MGVTLMEFGIYMRKGVMFTMKGSYKLVSHHPFLVCAVCFIIYISRSFPLMFSLLVSASPVVVCTAVLLGTLLFYGQQNRHETEIEMKTKYEAVSLKHRLSLDSNVSEQNERHFVERCGESKRDDNVESSLLVNKLSDIRVGGGSVDGSSKGRRSFGVESENSEENGALSDREKGEWNEDGERGREREGLGDGEVMADHYAIISKVIGELLESESDHEKSEGDSCDSERGHRDELHEDDESGSDRGESSSPDDTSIEDIMPTMLDELHPLLDEEGAQPPQTSRAASEAALTEHSPRSSISSIESVDETDNQETDAADDDDDDEAQDEKEDHTKSVITWTEEDQKNLMEVGNSEIERNRRLERILRRRKNRSMVPEINLMDFENPDFQFQIPPISTARQNPFDLPHDSLPGSAPSVMLQRKNPFDIPYDDEDDPNETAEESREELKQPSLSRQPFLRRRDNFTARPSIFSPNRQERLPVKLRPFFVAEQTNVDESSYSPFKRQSSDHSSVHETESVASVEYHEDEKLEEGDDPSGDQDQDQVSNDQETADTTASSRLADDVPSREPVYDTDTSPTAVGKNYSSSSSFADALAEPDRRGQGEVPCSSSRCSDRSDVEHSVDGESVASYHEMQVADTSSTASTSMEENTIAGTTPHNPKQEILDPVEGENAEK